LGFEIKTGNSEMESLKTAIAEIEATLGSLNTKIEEVSAGSSTRQADPQVAHVLPMCDRLPGELPSETEGLKAAIAVDVATPGSLITKVEERGAALTPNSVGAKFELKLEELSAEMEELTAEVAELRAQVSSAGETLCRGAEILGSDLAAQIAKVQVQWECADEKREQQHKQLQETIAEIVEMQVQLKRSDEERRIQHTELQVQLVQLKRTDEERRNQHTEIDEMKALVLKVKEKMAETPISERLSDLEEAVQVAELQVSERCSHFAKLSRGLSDRLQVLERGAAPPAPARGVHVRLQALADDELRAAVCYIRLGGLSTTSLNGAFGERGAFDRASKRWQIHLHNRSAAVLIRREYLFCYEPHPDDRCELCKEHVNLFAFPPCDCDPCTVDS